MPYNLRLEFGIDLQAKIVDFTTHIKPVEEALALLCISNFITKAQHYKGTPVEDQRSILKPSSSEITLSFAIAFDDLVDLLFFLKDNGVMI